MSITTQCLLNANQQTMSSAPYVAFSVMIGENDKNRGHKVQVGQG